ncbi:beta-N-acetylhexosaminidase [Erwinia typographi]|uniref:beta-N-acetylhexosaminidase n=1 Tax=Erwinia typographi TaxID=371042 RepID=A0A0A4A9M6_9GAMM|nr:family 20 glycosylhydrolase [Erwinia typographi]KGT94528.1 beta-N-acetylhexosaminidase [Erwinia typographi]
MPCFLRWSLLSTSLFVSLYAHATPAGNLPLMPWPQQVEQPKGGGSLALNNRLAIRITGDDLPGAVDRWRQRIGLQTGWQMLPQDANEAQPTIEITIARRVDPLPQLDSDESYSLKVSSAGVQLDAATRFGAMRGMETLLQLVQNGRQNSGIPYVSIHDSPRFPWRGILIDSARHFMPLETIRRQIDGIAAARMNVFHWHLTDDQGWRFASTHFPQLQEKGSDGLFYSQDQMREIVRYAADRGVRVVPEIDLPGHATALAVAMPELISAPGPYQIERGWGVFKPLLDPSNEQVYQFVDTLVGEVAAVFPDPWLHIGGDEVDATQWKASPHIQAFMQQKGLKDEHALQAYFNQRVEKILQKHHRQMLGWDEIAHPDLPKSILIQSWQGQDALGEVSKNGYRGILSAGFYLDQAQPASYHYRNEVYPVGLNGQDRLQKDDTAQSWQFTMPRLKGSAVKGSFTLIERDGKWRGFIDFAGKSRRMVRDIDWLAPDRVTFTVDTWMGEFSPVVLLADDKMSGYMLVGNVRYPAQGSRLKEVPVGLQPSVPDEQQMKDNLLGGEAALWAEIVNPQVIDVRLWPRAFVVAERLWSAKDVTNQQNMYRRLAAVDSWSAVSVGLQQHAQAQTQMIRLANGSSTVPLQIFAEALEPAQYYTRQHLKFQAGHYDLNEPLNRLADVLPAESDKIRELNLQVEKLTANRGDRQAMQAIRHQLRLWQQNIPEVMPLLAQNYPLQPLRPVAEQLQEVSSMGLSLLDAMEENRTFGANEVAAMHAKLDKAAETQDEVVLALVYPIEKLLRAGAPG